MLENVSDNDPKSVVEVPTFVVLDLDRTLLNTDELNKYMCAHIETERDTTPEDGDAWNYIQQQKGRSFSVLGYLRTRFGSEQWDVLQKQMVTMADAESLLSSAVLYPYVAELLNALDEARIPYAILTYGDSENQQFKLDILHATIGRKTEIVDALITDEQYKGEWIARTWRQNTGGAGEEWFYVHPDLHPEQTMKAKTIVVVDDKAQNAQANDAHIIDFIVDNTAPGSAAGARSIRDLYELIHTGRFNTWVKEAVQQKVGMDS